MQEVWGSDVPRRGIGTWGGWASQPPTGQLRDSVHAEAPPNPYLQCFEERLCRRLYATRPLCSGPKFCDDRCRHVATFPAFANFANSIMADMARYRCERRLVICSLRKAMVRDPAGLILPPHPRECCFHRRWAFPRHSLRDDSVRDDCAGSCISRFVSRAVQLEDLRTFLRRRLRRSVCVCVWRSGPGPGCGNHQILGVRVSDLVTIRHGYLSWSDGSTFIPHGQCFLRLYSLNSACTDAEARFPGSSGFSAKVWPSKSDIISQTRLWALICHKFLACENLQ